MKRVLRLTPALAAAALAVPAYGIDVFGDDFSDGDRDGWFLIDGEATLGVESASPQLGSGNELRLQTTDTDVQAFATHFDSVSLTNVGDFIQM